MAFQPIQSLVAAAVERYPDRVAVDGPAGRLTYGELDALAEDVAVSLQRRGVGAGALVPLLIPDRGEFAAALLGVLRIGAVAVPLDPAARRFPSARALTDAAAVVLGAGAGPLAAGLLAHGAVPVDIGAAVGASADGRATHHEPAPDDPCYVFFTSGSTGTPKGIVGRLCAIDHFVRWEVGLLGVRPQWRVSQLV